MSKERPAEKQDKPGEHVDPKSLAPDAHPRPEEDATSDDEGTNTGIGHGAKPSERHSALKPDA